MQGRDGGHGKATSLELINDRPSKAGHQVESVELYDKAALVCSAEADSASKQVFERLVEDEESHEDQFEKQREHIKRFGPSYLHCNPPAPRWAAMTPNLWVVTR